MDLKIKGKKALVMGASQGIGLAIAKALSDEGALVAICARSEDKLKIAAHQSNAKLTVRCDLSKPGEAKHAVEKTILDLGGIDILVTNTGGPPKGTFDKITTEQWQQGFQGLWMSAVEAIQASLPQMKFQKWGRIILVTSAAAKEPMTGLTVSNGLRAGLLGLTKSISHEIAAHGITINALLPGYTRTERLMELGIPEEKITGQIPAGRLAEPSEMGNLAAFLASEGAGYITGQAICSDGGYLKGI